MQIFKKVFILLCLLLSFSEAKQIKSQENVLKFSNSRYLLATNKNVPPPSSPSPNNPPPILTNGTTNSSINVSPPTAIGNEINKLRAKSPTEMAIAITIGVLMLVVFCTCLVCCLCRRGGRWVFPIPAFIKKFFTKPQTKYSKYYDFGDDS